MKKFFITIVIVFISTSIFSQSFYRYRDKKIELKVDSTMVIVLSDKHLADEQNKVLEEKLQKGDIKSFQKISNNRFLVIGNNLNPQDYDYISNVYRNDENGTLVILPRIVVMFKHKISLQQVLNNYDGKLIQDSGGNQKYILRCNATRSEEVLQLVNELDTRDDVIWCEPEFLSNYEIDNPLYPQQYYLKNTGQNGGTTGIDINVEPAWNYTNGNPCITVAVIDCGVDRDHEDMGSRVLEGFTIRNATGFGEPQNVNSLNNKAHGMACAGIIAASNNTIGIRGIASNVNILPVNIVPDAAYIDGLGRTIQGFGSNIEIAQAISWAWHRADVLSCSWGGGALSNDITSAIDSARTFGRNGNGTVVVFASGNDWPNATDVAYPARLDGVITVGAIDNHGVIWNYSQRGASMDLVAPSGNVGSGDVTTTDRMGNLGYNTSGNYMNNFGGTSAACPQVSGVAALLLSIRPNLTEAQVRTTLQQTATDMGASGFDNTYGYGRVNAYAAVQAIYPYFSGPTSVCYSGATFTLNNLPPVDSIIWSCGSRLTISSGQNSDNCIFYPTSNGSSFVSVRLVTACGSITLPQKTVWAGLKASFSGPTSILAGGTGTYTATTTCGASPITYEWWLREEGTGVGATVVGYGTPLTLTSVPRSSKSSVNPAMSSSSDPIVMQPIQRTYYDLSLIVSDANGNYTTSEQQIMAYGDVDLINMTRDIAAPISQAEDVVLRAYPNPATNETTISIEQGSPEASALNPASTETTFDRNTEWDLEVYDSMQRLKLKKQRLRGSNATINTQSWKEGVYMVRVKYNDETLAGKLVVKH